MRHRAAGAPGGDAAALRQCGPRGPVWGTRCRRTPSKTVLEVGSLTLELVAMGCIFGHASGVYLGMCALLAGRCIRGLQATVYFRKLGLVDD